MKKHIVYLWVLVGIWGCNTSKTTTQDNNETTAQPSTSNTTSSPVVIRFSQFPCFGTCPYHEMKIQENGNAFYWGKRDVTNIGKYETTIPSNQVQKVLRVADSIHFFELDTAYVSLMTDLPTTVIFIQNGDKSHQVRAYGPVPDNLEFFIGYLYDFSQAIAWSDSE